MVKIAHASKNENGTYKNGKRGDQTGAEVCIRDWYNRPWTHVIRAKNDNVRVKIAYAAESAAKNNMWGYSQLDRNSGLLESSKYGFDPSKVTIPVNTDCSALITVACIYAGVPQNVLYKYGNSSVTSNLRSRLQSTNMFEVFTGKEYTTRSDKLMRGDILLSEGHHVAIVVDVPQKTSANPTEPISIVALRVIEGDYGTGEKRRRRLSEAGYNPDEVQKEVNRLLKK